jgi:hypothetical protein
LFLGLRQLPRRLIDGGAIVGVVLVEQRGAFGDLIAASDMDRGDEAGLGRPCLYEIAFDIALPLDDRGILRTQIEPPAGEGGERQEEKRWTEPRS